MLALKGEAGRASPETVAWPCDRCLSLGPVENEGTVLNLCSQATLQKKKRKQRARTFLFVGDPCQVRQWLTFCEATHGAELCASVFHLSKLTTGINDSFPDSGSGGKGALTSQQGPGGPLPFWSFSCIMPLTRYSRARESWLFRWKYLGRNVSPSQPRTFPVAAKPNRDHLSSSFPQADHRLRWYEGERGAIPSCGPSPSWEVIRTSFSSPSGPVQLAIFGPSSVSVLQSTCCMKKIFILIPLKTWFFFFFFFLQFCLFILGCAESSLLGTVLQLPRAGTTF